MHGVPLATVHFHEVGALDSIIDIAGAAVGLHRLGIERVFCAPLPLSRGLVRTTHGQFPLPAPATAELLQGLPVVDAASERELVTPTGAAIAAEIAAFAPLPAMTLTRTGYGVGGWQLADRPNLLRGLLGEAAGNGETDRVDGPGDPPRRRQSGMAGPPHGAPAGGRRPGRRLLPPADEEEPPRSAGDGHRRARSSAALGRLLLHESSAIGVRQYPAQRRKLGRRSATVATPLGEAEVKLLYEGERLVRVAPEYESCRRLAAAAGRPLPEVYRLVERAADSFFESQVPN